MMRFRLPARASGLAAALLLGAAVAVPATPAAALPSAAASLATVQIDGVAFAQVVVGSTVFVGGSFTTARPAGAAAGTATSTRRNLLAYDLTTGRLKAWHPSTNGVVRALAASADGATIYAVGAFTTVNGHARKHVAAIRAIGGVRTAFHPSLNAAASAVAVHGSTVYVGGSFTAAGSTARSHAAAFERLHGTLRPWRPSVNGDVLALTVRPSGTSVVLGGRFGNVDGRSTPGTARVGTKTGTTALRWTLNTTVRNHGPHAAIWSLTTSGGAVIGTGYSYNSGVKKRLEGTFVASWASGAVRWIEDCHGDTYSAARAGSTVYVAGHAHDCTTIGGFGETTPETYHRALAFSWAATGTIRKNLVSPYSSFAGQPAPTLKDWMPVFDFGTATGQDQGPWSVVTAGDWVLYAGEFRHVNGTVQQGLVRFKG